MILVTTMLDEAMVEGSVLWGSRFHSRILGDRYMMIVVKRDCKPLRRSAPDCQVLELVRELCSMVL